MVSPEEWQKDRPKEMTPEEWEKRREISAFESAVILLKKSWKLVLVFFALVLAVLLTPHATKVADCIRSFFKNCG